MDEDDGLLPAMRDQNNQGEGGCLSCFRTWDVRWEDVWLLAQGRLTDFRFRRERRLFDMVDSNHTGYVTLDEIIRWRERHKEGAVNSMEHTDVPLLNMQPDLTRSLVALYHFDVRLDGHITFNEFILMQDYLRKMDGDEEDSDMLCWCVPRRWFRKRRARRKREDDLNSPMRSTMERVLSRKVRTQGSLHELEQVIVEEDEAAEDAQLLSPELAVSPRLHHGSVNVSSNLADTPGGMDHGNGSPMRKSKGVSFADEPEQEEDEEEEDEESRAKAAQQEELRQQRRAMLVATLKNSRGRKRFMEWLYKLADTSQTDEISVNELIVFLKAIAADGINPEALVDPSEDFDMETGETDGVVDIALAKKHVCQKSVNRMLNDTDYLHDLAQRIIKRYDDSKTGTLLKDEFMQLAAMVEREYELYHLNDSEYNGCDQIGPYRLIRKLGKGAEGVVKLGINQETGLKKAVKIIKKGNIASMSRIDREVEAMVKLDHPCVVSVDEVLETDSSIFLVMEFCAGGHLEDYISPKRPISSAAARYYFSQLCMAVAYCHENGVCHRDLRVENLMLDNKGNLKITDFGHAGIFEQGWDVFQTMLVGSVSHLAPEQVEGTVYSGEKIDIWSAGIILYIMVTGQAPFQAETPEELLEDIRFGRYKQPDSTEEGCNQILAKCLEVQHANRPTAVQLMEMEWMTGPKEKLVLQHSEFMLAQRVGASAKWLEGLREQLKDCDVDVNEKYTADANEDEDVEATVRTVEADEDGISAHMSMRAVSVTMMHCVHRTHTLVFKVTVTMMSPDAGQANPYPIVSFDLQSGEAAQFQRLYRKIRAHYFNQISQGSKGPVTKTVQTDKPAPFHAYAGASSSKDFPSDNSEDEAPLVEFAAAMGLDRCRSYHRALIDEEKQMKRQDSGSGRGGMDSPVPALNRESSKEIR